MAEHRHGIGGGTYLKGCPGCQALRREAKYRRADYPELMVKQDGKCAICGNPGIVFHVDHNHETGAVRGLLCSNCNRGIGLLQDNPNLLAKAADYLRGA